MQYQYSKKYQIGFSQLDSSFRLGVSNALTLVEDMMTEYFGTIGSDNVLLMKEYQAIWVLTKTRIEFQHFPSWRDVVLSTNYTINLKSIRTEIESIFTNENNETLFVAKQEICPIDLETRKIRRINSISYPQDMECKKSKLQNDFTKIQETFVEEDLDYSFHVLFSDVDHNFHTNNVAYVRFILNSLPSEFYQNHKIKAFEIHYINESREQEELRVYRKTKENQMIFLIRSKDKDIVRAILDFEKNAL